MRARHTIVVAVCLLAACAAPPGAQLDVVCSTTIVGDVVRQIAGKDATVSVLFPIGADPHAHQASPQDAMAIEAADVVFLNGAGLETPLVPLLEGATGRVVDLSMELALQRSAAGEEEGDVDPHVWFDPLSVVQWTRAIARTLSEMDPEHGTDFRDRAAAYEAQLLELDAWIRDRVATIPLGARQLVTDHEAFGYFAERYGFEQIGTIFPGTSALAEPSARDLAALEDAIRTAGIPAVFVGTTVSATLAEQVAADTGTRIIFLYTGSLGDAGGPVATYVDLMRFDVDQIVAGLSGTP
jgi:ABC-type Zn uptake system ZnuABC Zn-binding protein ZnuA